MSQNQQASAQLQEVFDYYRNLLTLSPNLYSLTLRVTQDNPSMLSIQIQIPQDFPQSCPRLHAKGFHAPPFINPKTGQVMNLKALNEWQSGSFRLLSVVGELHHMLINYSRQPQAFDISYQVTRDEKLKQKNGPMLTGQTEKPLPRSSHIKGGFIDKPVKKEEVKQIQEEEDFDSESLKKPDIEKIMEQIRIYDSKKLQRISDNNAYFNEVYNSLTAIRINQEKSDELRQKAYILAKENMKVREEYLLKENVNQMLQDYEELKQQHDKLAQEQQSSKMKQIVVAKLKSDYNELVQRYRSLDSAFLREEDSVPLSEIKKDYLSTAKRAKVIEILLNNLN